MTTLRGMTWEHPRGHGCLVAAAARYADLTGVEVRWEQRSLQDFADAPLETLAENHDLLVIDHPHVPAAAQTGVLAPLDGAGDADRLADLAAHTVGPSHASYQHAGRQWGLAVDAAAQVAAYRPDLLPEPPRDWDAVLALAAAGRVLWPAKPVDAFSSLVTVSAGRAAARGDRTAFLVADDVAVALDLLHRLARAVPARCLDQNPIEVAEELSRGEQYAYAPLLFGYTNYSRSGFRLHRLRYVDIPAGPDGPVGSLLGGAGIAVSALSRQCDAARAFAFWVTGPEVQRGVYFDGGGQPGHGLAWQDDELNARTLDFFRGTRSTLEHACVRPRSPGYPGFQDTVSGSVTATLRGELSDAELIERIEAARPRLQEAQAHADR